jgi:hypothetical protein
MVGVSEKMNTSRITAFGGAAHSETDLKDDNASLSIEEFLATVLGKHFSHCNIKILRLIRLRKVDRAGRP